VQLLPELHQQIYKHLGPREGFFRPISASLVTFRGMNISVKDTFFDFGGISQASAGT
jgi:hypothetical protein